MWKETRWQWFLGLGIPAEKIRWYKHEKLAHYASDAYDIEYAYGFFGGDFKEVEGIHARGDWDLSQHAKFSGVNLDYYDEETKTRFIPHIMETSVGLGSFAGQRTASTTTRPSAVGLMRTAPLVPGVRRASPSWVKGLFTTK